MNKVLANVVSDTKLQLELGGIVAYWPLRR